MNKDFVCGYAFGTLITVIIISSTVVINNRKIPQAIDVYKDKTTLEIIYKDSVPIDSVVVFK